MIVIDVGCQPHGEDVSVGPLIERFQPELLYGFDPHPDLEEGIECIGATLVVRRRAAAWTRNGTIPVSVNGLRTGVDEREGAVGTIEAPCIDLPSFIFALPTFDPYAPSVILKLDAEGAEYPLLKRIAWFGLDRQLALVLVEWHTGEKAHGLETEQPILRCPVEAWE